MADQLSPASKPIEISHPCILLRINRLYRPGITGQELYDITRGIWKVGPRRQRAIFTLSVYRS